MPTGEDRKLKLVKDAPTAAGGGMPARSVARRAVTRRRIPRQPDPVAAILERLDEEPVDLGGSGNPRAAEAAGLLHAGQPAAGAVSADRTTTSGATGKQAATDQPTAVSEATSAGKAARARRGAARLALDRRLVVGAILVVALCAALTVTGIFGRLWYQDRALDKAHQQALAAAKQTTVNFVSVSASSVDSDLQRILNGATGDFKDQFGRGQSQVRQAVVENNVESRGTVLRAGLLSGDLRTAVVLVAVDATVKNAHSPDGKASHYRIQVDVTKDPKTGTWLVSKLQFVG